VDIRTGTITAVEALLRVDHPHRGLLTPADFIDVAESTDLIIAMEEWALPEACTQVTLWHRHRPVELSVNMSGRHISLPGVTDRLLQTLTATGTAARTLCVEITERVLINAEAPTLNNLHTLRQAGVRLALNDFGTGYSPLTYLQVLPIDTVKIDRSFTAGLGTATRSHAIVTALTALGRALGLRMIAEGVETRLQLTQLRELGCDLAQGYHLHRPTDAATIEKLLRHDTVPPTH